MKSSLVHQHKCNKFFEYVLFKTMFLHVSIQRAQKNYTSTFMKTLIFVSVPAETIMSL